MKRPRFFEDLDRSLSGEPEPEEKPADSGFEREMARMALLAQGAARLHGIENQTATGAQIAAQQGFMLTNLSTTCQSVWFSPIREE